VEMEIFQLGGVSHFFCDEIMKTVLLCFCEHGFFSSSSHTKLQLKFSLGVVEPVCIMRFA